LIIRKYTSEQVQPEAEDGTDGVASQAQESVLHTATPEEINEVLGEKLVKQIDEEEEIDFSSLTLPDNEVMAQVQGMSDEYVRNQIKQLEKEALELEAKTISLRERAHWDKYHGFNLKEHDIETIEKLNEVNKA